MRSLAATTCLWVAVIAVAIGVGGNVFQMVVVDPIWSASPPESVRSFFSEPRVLTSLRRFHVNPLLLIGLLCLVAAPLLAWNIPELRNWLLLAIALELVVVLGTIFYVYPINDKLFLQPGGGLDATAITALTRRWLVADRIRLVFKFAVFLCLLRAVSLSRPHQ